LTHKPFHLYKRPTKKPGKYIYYVQFFDEAGNRMTARSTGQTSKAAAETWAVEELKKGLVKTQRNILFSQYAEDWWIWDKCSYIKGRIARGATLSRSYTDSMRTYLTLHILPYFGNKKLQNITPKMIEDWIMKLREKPGKTGDPLSHTTVNHCLTCLKIMLKEAVRLDYIYKSPAASITQLRESPKEKSILTVDEVMELFREDEIDRIWEGDIRHYTINILAASTGMRMGEIQALMRQFVHDNYIGVFLHLGSQIRPQKRSKTEL
jgi:integrase